MKPYIKPCIEACQHVFKNFLGLEIIAEEPYLLDKKVNPGWDISGVIGLTGDVRGVIVISMKETLACTLTSRLIGKEYTQIDDDVTDAIGEIVNIISGNAKQGLEKLFHLVISIPTIVRGQEHSIVWPRGEQTKILCIPFKIFKNEGFTLSVTIETN